MLGCRKTISLGEALSRRPDLVLGATRVAGLPVSAEAKVEGTADPNWRSQQARRINQSEITGIAVCAGDPAPVRTGSQRLGHGADRHHVEAEYARIEIDETALVDIHHSHLPTGSVGHQGKTCRAAATTRRPAGSGGPSVPEGGKHSSAGRIGFRCWDQQPRGTRNPYRQAVRGCVRG